jgi:SNF2 family DNA or RNA helicase
MRVRPHDYQLKGAAQINYLCESRFRGALVGDGMGVGKTLQAILAMWLQRDKPGFSMVIAPKSVCLQWVDEISEAWDEVSAVLNNPEQPGPSIIQVYGKILTYPRDMV